MSTAETADVRVVDNSEFARNILTNQVRGVLSCTLRQALLISYASLLKPRNTDAKKPGIVVTTDLQNRAQNRVAGPGASAIWVKPFNADVLRDLLHERL